jgi:Flp pilus assembly protein TadB
MGVPPVLIHFRLGVSLKSTSIFGVHPSLKRLQPSLPALQTWIAGESSATPRNTICVVIHTIVHIYILLLLLLLLVLLLLFVLLLLLLLL